MKERALALVVKDGKRQYWLESLAVSLHQRALGQNAVLSPSQPASQMQPSATSSQHPWATLRHPPRLQHSDLSSATCSHDMSTCTCHQGSEATVNSQINLTFHASYVYLSMSYCYDLDDAALKNSAKYSLRQSLEEREHAEKTMKLQNQKGGCIFLQDVEKPDCDDWENGMNATECASHLLLE